LEFSGWVRDNNRGVVPVIILTFVSFFIASTVAFGFVVFAITLVSTTVVAFVVTITIASAIVLSLRA
jgi:hypothetical protein